MILRVFFRTVSSDCRALAMEIAVPLRVLIAEIPTFAVAGKSQRGYLRRTSASGRIP